MAAQAVTFENLRTALRAKNLEQLSPIYLLHGEEGYYIDELLKDFENLLNDDEKEFNQYILYGPQVEPAEVIDICRRYPMMADRQVVILKECQSVNSTNLDKLKRYVAEPSPTTIFVICSRGAALKGKELMAALRKSNATIFESKKIAEYQLGANISNYINARGLNVQPKALEMLKEYIGTNLDRMYNELNKLIGILGPGATVTPESIEQHIGVSKDYNAFELVDALAMRDSARAIRIANYFRANPKAVPQVMVTAAIFNFYSDLLITYFEKDKSEHGLMQALKLKSTFQLKRFNAARQRYNAFQVIEIIRAIRQFDTQSKGIGSRRDPYDLFHELIFRILTAPGTLFPKA
jgi:DNA polymerase-3 subunit delta